MSISVFEVIIPVQASSLCGYRKLSERVTVNTFLLWLIYLEIAVFFFRRLCPIVASWHSIIFEERCILRFVSQAIRNEQIVSGIIEKPCKSRTMRFTRHQKPRRFSHLPFQSKTSLLPSPHWLLVPVSFTFQTLNGIRRNNEW